MKRQDIQFKMTLGTHIFGKRHVSRIYEKCLKKYKEKTAHLILMAKDLNRNFEQEDFQMSDKYT